MKVKFGKLQENAKNMARNKEMVSSYNVTVIYKGEIKNPITCRVYMGRSNSASTVYASIWVNGINLYCSGSGNAGGYGYHKESAAIGYAIMNAGIELEKPIDGRGDSAIIEALESITRALGYKGKLYIVRN